MLQIEVTHHLHAGQKWKFSTEVLAILFLGNFAACVCVCSLEGKTMFQLQSLENKDTTVL